MLSAGDTFLAGNEDTPLHLYVVLTSPTAGEVVVVSITTRREKSEALVILRPGDHPFIQHESVVAYAYAAIRQVSIIEDALRTEQAKPREPVTPALLRRIRAGLLDSDRTPNQVREYCKTINFGGINALQ